VKFTLSIPLKTFLLGEYYVLRSGEALVLSSGPRFLFHVEKMALPLGTMDFQAQLIEAGFPAESPAHMRLLQKSEILKNIKFSFVDPLNGKGGFGASTAQYLCAELLIRLFGSSRFQDPNQVVQDLLRSTNSIWHSYRDDKYVSAEGVRPSGADLVSQIVGGVMHLRVDPFVPTKFIWPFSDLQVVIVPTGQKLVTHEHLKGLRGDIDTFELSHLFQMAIDAYTSSDSLGYCLSIQDTHAELLEQGLVSQSTAELVALLLMQKYVRAAKGCGAMGHDAVAVYIHPDNRNALDVWLSSQGLHALTSSDELADGIRIDGAELMDESESEMGEDSL
jgi:hypothetical protein